MAKDLSPILLSELRRFIVRNLGLEFPKSRQADLERRLQLAADELGFPNVNACMQSLISSSWTPHQVEILAGSLTVGETYFFRDRAAFDVFEKRLLPEIISARAAGSRRLRIWSAGCCTGEEPYTLAILTSEHLPDLPRWSVTIRGTDLNPRFLARCRRGIYRDWSFRGVSNELRDSYFKKLPDGEYEIRRHIKRMVTFSYLNLVENNYPSPLNNTGSMDIIFCRNVLMYFQQEQLQAAARRIASCLQTGGWLVVGAGEGATLPLDGLTPISIDGRVFYRKEPLFSPPPARKPREQPLPPPPPVKKTENIDAEDCTRRAHEFADQGQLEEALHWTDKALRVSRFNAELYQLKATILQEQGRIQEAYVALRTAVAIDSKAVMAHFAIGCLGLHRASMAIEARNSMHIVLELLEDHAEDEILVDAEGLTAGRLRDVVLSMLGEEDTL